MIINTGLRTDIVHHYSKWLINRFRAGYVYARNPLFPNHVNRYVLHPDKIDAVVFCSKNYFPILSDIREISDSYRTYFFVTVTPYEKEIEPSSPEIADRIKMCRELSKIVGRDKVAWRYDPVLFTKKYTFNYHADSFRMLSEALSPFVSRCIFSFVDMFIRLQQIMPELVPMRPEDKIELVKMMHETASRYSLPVEVCCDKSDYSLYGVKRRGCLNAEDLSKANGCGFRTSKSRAYRIGCVCTDSRDIGWYDSCPSGCKYCNVNRGFESVEDNFSMHDPDSPILIGNIKKTDVLGVGQQTSVLRHDEKQITMFDL